MNEKVRCVQTEKMPGITELDVYAGDDLVRKESYGYGGSILLNRQLFENGDLVAIEAYRHNGELLLRTEYKPGRRIIIPDESGAG